MKREKKYNHIEGAMRKPGLIGFVVACLLAFGIWSLPHMNKDEFPQFTILQGVVVAVYPGATAEEVEAEVTNRLEPYLFTFPEINKRNTYSYSRNGIVYIFAELRTDVRDRDEAWSKIRHGLNLFRQTSLPAGVAAVTVIDDFGNTSSLLLAVESDGRPPRELEHYARQLSARLRTIPETGNIKLSGIQQEEIALIISTERLAAYRIPPAALQAGLALQGIRTTNAETEKDGRHTLVHVSAPYRTEYELGNQIIYTDPVSGSIVRLSDIAQIERRYKEPKQYVRYYANSTTTSLDESEQHNSNIKAANGLPCVIMSVEMYPGNNIVAYGKEVDRIISETQTELPPDVHFHRITDQPHVVDSSVRSFLRDLLFSILVVILVMLVLFPLKTALVSSTGVPVCIAIAIGLMYLFGIELNTVTLAALIVVLGMIVDDSVIVIDGYTDLLSQGHSRWYSAIVSTTALFIPMTLATCSISGMFFPMTHIITGPLGEFVQLFPWAVFFALTASIFYATWVIPSLATKYIRNLRTEDAGWFERQQGKFFTRLQSLYQRVLSVCFHHPWLTLSAGILSVAIGILLFTRLNVQMMPKAERECFAVEIHLSSGSSLSATGLIADSLARVLSSDERVLSVTSFVGCASPRFHATYSPQMPRPEYAQFVVTTRSQQATAELLKQYTPLYQDAFPNAYIRFKQMDYQAVKNPLEIRLESDDLHQLRPYADSIKQYMSQLPALQWIHSDYDEVTAGTQVTLRGEESGRLGVTEAALSLYLNQCLSGQKVTSIWEDDYEVPVMLYNSATQSSAELGSLPIPIAGGSTWVPLSEVADIVPTWSPASITHYNGNRGITIGADISGKASQPELQKQLEQYVSKHIEPSLPAGTRIKYGGLTAINNAVIPELAMSVVAALLVMFVLLIYHFGKIRVAVLALTQSLLCIFGACLGLWLFDLDFSITALLGLVSLIGIIVRNAIIMYEYAESLRYEEHKSLREASYQAGLRRMRPIFLTSATTALGVTPMIIAHTSLWMPMGVVICFGTLFTLPLVVTMLPVAYWKTM
ncbi:MAG: efflux RND transporter permease subunit [Paludibacteraceae bacterium]|nr:efflux RND transporter permease subunit [Paludibacteraceae bacterium]